MKDKFRRCRIIRITPELIFNVLFYWHKSKNITLPYVVNIPKDAIIGGIQYDYQRNLFLIKIVSKEFDIVASGEEMPWMDVYCISVSLAKKTQKRLIEEARKIQDCYDEDKKGRLIDG